MKKFIGILGIAFLLSGCEDEDKYPFNYYSFAILIAQENNDLKITSSNSKYCYNLFSSLLETKDMNVRYKCITISDSRMNIITFDDFKLITENRRKKFEEEEIKKKENPGPLTIFYNLVYKTISNLF